jgi:chromosome segregation ATPase
MRRDGISVRGSAGRPSTTWRILEAATVAGLLLIGLTYQWRMSGSVEDRQAEDARRISVLSGKVADLERQLSQRPEPGPAPVRAEPAPEQGSSHREGDLAAQLARLRGDYDAVVAGRVRLEESVSALSAQLDQFRRDSQTARVETERAQRDLRDAELALSRTRQDLESLRAARSTNASTIADQQIRLD